MSDAYCGNIFTNPAGARSDKEKSLIDDRNMAKAE
jgi:hypothetical protein